MEVLRLNYILILFFLITPYMFLQSQSRKKIYNAKVILTNGNEMRGILYEANEEGVLLFKRNLRDTVAFVTPAYIDLIKLRRKGKTGQGALIGLGAGVLFAAVMVATEEDDPNELNLGPSDGLYYSIFLPPIATGVGAMIASKSDKIIIEGKETNYSLHLGELKMYAYQ